MATPEEIAAAKTQEASDEAARVAAKAAEDAKSKANGNSTDDPKELESKWDAGTKKYIESLRSEAAKHRTDKKELFDRMTKLEGGLKSALGIEDNTPPEEQIQNLKSQTEAQAFRSAILEAAIENGVGRDQIDYFTFLIEKTASQLEEGDEITEDQMTEIIGKVKAAGGVVNNTTSINTAKKPNPQGGGTALTVEQFARLNVTAKSELYTKEPDKYAALMAEAKAKRLI